MKNYPFNIQAISRYLLVVSLSFLLMNCESRMLKIKGAKVAISAQASQNATILFQLEEQSEVKWLTRSDTKEKVKYFGNNHWYKIKKGEQEGWVYGGFTSLAEGGIYGQQGGRLFDKDLAIVLGEIYAMAGILNEDYRQLERFVNSHAYLFSAKSNLMIGAEKLGALAFNHAIEIYDKDAYKNALALGYNHQQALEVSHQVTQGSSDLGNVGLELVWLAQVLPAAAQGDWGPFNNTGTDRRRKGRAVWMQLRQFMQGTQLEETVRQAIGMGKAYNKEYIATLALTSGI